MNRTISIRSRGGLLAGALALALSVGGSRAHAEPDADLVVRAVKGIEAFYGKTSDFKADFAQEVRRAHLARPLKKSGHVYFQRPSAGSPRMRWDYVEPDKVYYVSDGDVLWSYEVATKQAIKMSVKDSELYDSLKFLFGQGDLQGSFDVTLGPKPADGLVALVLVPKAGQQDFKSLTLFVKPDTFQVVRSELVDPLDNVSTITFSAETYAPLKADGFKFTPPKDATIQDLTRQAPPPPPAPGPK